MGRMFNPPHPVSIVREDILPAIGLTVTEAARQLGISRVQAIAGDSHTRLRRIFVRLQGATTGA